MLADHRLQKADANNTIASSTDENAAVELTEQRKGIESKNVVFTLSNEYHK